MGNYIHPTDSMITEFINQLGIKGVDFDVAITIILKWFDENIEYSRLNAPYFPLQRSDIDVLTMKSGTCGDYSNLIISVLIALGYEAKYANIIKDCYGDYQTHICVAAWYEKRWLLIDATQPYRKWHGYDCPHEEFELFSPEEFLQKNKKEEDYWINMAMENGNKQLAGLYFAPWVHCTTIRETENELIRAFYLLSFEKSNEYQLYVYLQRYTKDNGFAPIVCRIQGERQYFKFSIHPAQTIWDEKQYSIEYEKRNIPKSYKSEYLSNLINLISLTKSTIYLL